MKELFKYFAVFALFCVVSSGFIGCGSSASVETTEVGNNEGKKEKKEDDFPSPPQKIVEAEFKLIDNESFNIKESEGQVTLINLWGVWCIPCIKEMPHLVEMQEKYKDKKFQVIGLNVGDADQEMETEKNIKAFAKKQNLNYKLGWIDRPELGELYKLARISAVPQSFLINRSGKLVGVFVGGGPKSINPMKASVEKWVNE